MPKYIYPFCIAASCMAAVSGCSQSGNAPDARSVQINGTPVPQALLEAVARGHNLHLDKPEQRDQALKLTTDLVLMAQAAQRDNFFADVQFQADVEAARLKGVADSGMAVYVKQTAIGDDVLKARYSTEVGQAGKLEYDFSQLLFASEDDALKAEGDILSGKAFPEVFDAWRTKAKLAKAFSRVRQEQLPPALAQALATMKNGETSKVPVKTEFGWHVVHLDIANPFTPPPFEQVKEGIRRTMLMQIGQQRLEKLREQAKVEYPAGVAPPAAKPAMNPDSIPTEKPAAEKKG